MTLFVNIVPSLSFACKQIPLALGGFFKQGKKIIVDKKLSGIVKMDHKKIRSSNDAFCKHMPFAFLRLQTDTPRFGRFFKQGKKNIVDGKLSGTIKMDHKNTFIQ